MKRLFALSLLAAAACGQQSAATPGAAEPASSPDYIGVWAADASWCGIEPGSADPSPIEITAGEFIGYENRCAITEVEETGDGGWRLMRTCEAEGVVVDNALELRVDGDRLTMTVDGGDAIEFVRCRGA